jgi:DNA-binding response OmpR family regulator
VVADRQTLLVVEDDGTIRRAIADLLNDEGYSVAAGGDLRAALLVLQRHPITAAILDWRLVDDTSEPILHHLARTNSSTAVVMVSAAAECAATAARFGVPMIRKPFDMNELPRAIADAIRNGRAPRITTES